MNFGQTIFDYLYAILSSQIESRLSADQFFPGG